MAAMNKEQIIAWLGKNVEKVVLAVQAVLLVGTVYMVWSESNAAVQPMPEVKAEDPKPKLNPKDPKTPMYPSYQKVMQLVTARPALDASEYLPIIQINVFDPKTVKNSDQLTKEADKGMEEAKALFEQGRAVEAQARVKKVLDSMPGHKGSLELKKRIDDSLKGSGASAAATPASPGG